jgi:hypothetical protein
LDKLWREIVREHLVGLKNALSSADLPDEHRTFLMDAIEMYTSCSGERPRGEPYVGNIMPLPGAMRFFIARCSPHAIRNLDDLNVVDIDLSYAWLREWFKPGLKELLQ